jgi:hypothetical protein
MQLHNTYPSIAHNVEDGFQEWINIFQVPAKSFTFQFLPECHSGRNVSIVNSRVLKIKHQASLCLGSWTNGWRELNILPGSLMAILKYFQGKWKSLELYRLCLFQRHLQGLHGGGRYSSLFFIRLLPVYGAICFSSTNTPHSGQDRLSKKNSGTKIWELKEKF